MASLVARLPANVAGDFFVDASCIDCGTCRWVAPASFASAGEASCVSHQPADEIQRRRAELALIACPVGAIGTVERQGRRAPPCGRRGTLPPSGSRGGCIIAATTPPPAMGRPPI